MYGLTLHSGRYVGSAELQRALSLLPFDCGTELHTRRMQQLGAIERLEARGTSYSNQDVDVLAGALNFLDAVAPEAAEELRHDAPRPWPHGFNHYRQRVQYWLQQYGPADLPWPAADQIEDALRRGILPGDYAAALIRFDARQAAQEQDGEAEELLDITYECPDCGHEWRELWSCACDSECPECGASNITATTWEHV